MSEEAIQTIFQQLLKASTIDFKNGASNLQEAQYQQWTTYSSIRMWFDSWENFILDWRFGKIKRDKAIIPDDQKARIIKLDESVTMEGSSQQQGNGLAMIFSDKSLPILVSILSKFSPSTTMITGCNALGEVLPPQFHFQLQPSQISVNKIDLRLRHLRKVFFTKVWTLQGPNFPMHIWIE